VREGVEASEHKQQEVPMPNGFLVMDNGSIIAIRPLTEEALQWLGDNVAAEGWQWLGGSLCVDRHYAAPLIEGIEADSFEVSRA
jgi:hypothetical protein